MDAIKYAQASIVGLIVVFLLDSYSLQSPPKLQNLLSDFIVK